ISWATFYGGGFETANGITADKAGNIYITGYTASVSGIATSGAYQTSLAGSLNTIIAKFSPNGSLIWATYYGGGNDDEGTAIVADPYNNIYIAGYASSTSGVATSGAHQTSHGGGYDAFIARFTSSGTPVWATYYGDSYDDFAFGISPDNKGNVYVTGATSSESGIATNGAYQSSFSSSSGALITAFVAKFNSGGSLLW